MPLVTTKAGAGSFGLGWGAAASEELGGMVLIEPTSIAYTGTSASIGANGSVEFTACSSLSLNGVFDATYDNYVIAMNNFHSSQNAVFFRLRASGADESSASNFYTSQGIEAAYTSFYASRYTTTLWYTNMVASPVPAPQTTNIYGPFLAQPTAFRSIPVDSRLSAVMSNWAGTHGLSTSYDGITIFTTTGNLTGLVSLYGLVGA